MFQTIFLQATDGGGSSIAPFIFMALIFVVMYFFMIRPQSKKAKEQKKFIEEIKKGDKVVTAGGIHGKVIKVNNDGTFLIEVDSNTKLKIEKSVISMDFTKSEPAANNKEKS